MLSTIRNFSKTIYAKVLLGIVVIPFIFWGMGSSFGGGSKNIVVKIDKEKFSIQDFTKFIQSFGPFDQKITPEEIENFLTKYIGNKLIEKEYEKLGIIVSEKSLSQLIKNQKEFKKDNIFSRTEYEKFLLANNFNAPFFEAKLATSEKSNQLLNFIGGGIVPSEFMVNTNYNKINQKRYIQLINLDHVFEKEYNFSDNEIKSYYENNIDKYNEVFKSIKLLEINPNMLTGTNEYNDLFFKKLDEIYDDIASGEKMNSIVTQYNLEKETTFILNEKGQNINYEIIKNIPDYLIKNIFSLDNSEPTALIEAEDKFFILEIIKSEKIQKKIQNEEVKKNIKENLQKKVKIKLMSEIISKINQNNFRKNDFDKFSKDNGANIQKITIENLNDAKTLKKGAVNQIYSYPEKQIIVVNDINLTDNFIVYIEKVENASISYNSDEYKKYFDLSKIRLTSELFNSYDNYIKKKYDIDINYKSLNIVKNYFN